ncbi:hypothetical protein A6302_00055 [Methylobrevis pamukkalensis]|uniref:Uncharacterized protein n=1 Tax=Methylobrevis pamukkalensis TaxID=1439726 RepID=A0A1E3H8D9_9HYPH|nr:hypothetical protein A6302_00055 [Methylobrevis pamukkalensis]
MTTLAERIEAPSDPLAALAGAIVAIDALIRAATVAVKDRVSVGGRIDGKAMDREQRAAHGLAWLATYGESLRELGAYRTRMEAEGRFGETERLLVLIGAGEYLAQVFGGIPMNQGEIVRLADLGIPARDIAAARTADVEMLMAEGCAPEPRAALVAAMRQKTDARSSATAASTRPWRPFAPRCAALPRKRCCRMPTSGT